MFLLPSEMNSIFGGKWVPAPATRTRRICVAYDLRIDSSCEVLVLVLQRTHSVVESAGECYWFWKWLRTLLSSVQIRLILIRSRSFFRQFKIMDRGISSKTILHLFMSCTLWCVVHAQHPDGMILLKQGAVIGVRIVAIICIFSIVRLAVVFCFSFYLCFSCAQSLSQSREINWVRKYQHLLHIQIT